MTLRVIDIETTGTDPATDKIVEIASCDLTRDWLSANEMQDFVNPGIPIPALSSAVHHIIDADVELAPPFEQVIPKYLGADAYVAHNAAFEQGFLDEALGNPQWVCTFKSALRVWPELPSHSNQFLRYHLGLVHPLGFVRTDIDAHHALSDVIVTGAIFVELSKKASWADMRAWTEQPALHSTLTFGKHRGVRYADAPADYLEWIAYKSDLDADTKFSAEHWLMARKTEAAE